MKVKRVLKNKLNLTGEGPLFVKRNKDVGVKKADMLLQLENVVGFNQKRYVSCGPAERKLGRTVEFESKKKHSRNKTFESYVNKIANVNINQKRTSEQTKSTLVSIQATNLFSRRKAYQRGKSENRREIHYRAKLAVTPIDYIKQRLDNTYSNISPAPMQSELRQMKKIQVMNKMAKERMIMEAQQSYMQEQLVTSDPIPSNKCVEKTSIAKADEQVQKITQNRFQ